MSKRTMRVSAALVVTAVVVGMAGWAWAEGYVLGETKEKLSLKYDVAVTDHSSGRVTIVLTLADAGRLEPLDEVQLVIPAQEKNSNGSYWMDLVVSIEMVEGKDGNRVGRVHLLRELAERSQIQLNTHTLDGKVDPLTRLHHVIPIAKYLESTPTTGEAKDAPKN